MISLIKYLLFFIFGVILYLSNIQINKFTIGNPSKDSSDRNNTWYFYEYNGKIYCDRISDRTEWLFPPQEYHIQPPQNNQMGNIWTPTLTVTGNDYFDFDDGFGCVYDKLIKVYVSLSMKSNDK